MSILSSSSVFPYATRPRGLFSDRSAFQSPKLKKTLSNVFTPQPRSSNNFSIMESKITKDQPNKSLKQRRILRIAQEDDDELELKFAEPVKKVKVAPEAQAPSMQKSYQLSMDEVFNTKEEVQEADEMNFFDSDSEEGSSLSFLSSDSSMDLELEEKKEDDDDKVIEVGIKSAKSKQSISVMIEEEKAQQPVRQPIAVKNNSIANEKRTDLSTFFPVQPLSTQLMFSKQNNSLMQNRLLFETLNNHPTVPTRYVNLPQIASMKPVGLNLNQPLYPASSYIQPSQESLILATLIQEQQRQQLQAQMNYMEPMLVNEAAVKLSGMNDFQYDNDYCATRSTSVDQENSNSNREVSESFTCGKSLKGVSPMHIMIEEDSSPDSQTMQEQTKQPSKKKSDRKQGDKKSETRSKVQKEKRTRSLNLGFSINPKHMKIERRLNRLQLLRYQQQEVEEDSDLMKRINEANPYFQSSGDQSPETESEVDFFEGPKDSNMITYEALEATIPPFALGTYRRKTQCKSVWSPEDVDNKVVETFSRKLGEIFDFIVTDQEAVVKLLKSFNMDMLSALMIVRENKAHYADLLRLKIKKVGRRRI